MSSPESQKEIENESTYFRAKLHTVLSFAFFIVAIGIPLWWKTTETYRVALPYSRIDELAFSKPFSTIVNVLVPLKLKENIPSINNTLDETVQDSSVSYLNKIQYNVRVPTPSELEKIQKSSSFEGLSRSLLEAGLLSEPGQLLVVILSPETILFPMGKKVHISSHRVMYVKESSDIMQLIKYIDDIINHVVIKQGRLENSVANVIHPQKTKPDKATLWTIRTTPEYDITFSLVIPDPSETQAFWEIEKGVSAFLRPVLQKLKPVTQFNVQSQVLYYLSLGVTPNYDSSRNVSFLTFEQLPHTINPLEGKLGSHISVNPSFNFLVYIPKKSESPLYIYDETGSRSSTNAFSSPRWGGIYIHNIPALNGESSTNLQLVKVDVKGMMEVFISELRTFIGLDALVSDADIEFASLDSSCLTDWEMDYLFHKRTIENMATSMNTLKTLSGLLEEIGNIVINDEVGNYVMNAVEAIESSQFHFQENHLLQAFLFSKEAFVSSEKAFFDPSMLALLYFPDDQKYAVYVPLFLPVSVPVLLSLLDVYRFWKNRQKKLKSD